MAPPIAPRVGKYRIPKIRMDILLNDVNKVYTNNGMAEFSKETFRNNIGSTKDSSATAQKLLELKSLGLILGTDDKLHLSEIGKNIIITKDLERHTEIEKALRKVPLWSLFIENGGENISNDKVQEILIKDAGLPESEGKLRSGEIKKAFLRDLQTITNFDPSKFQYYQQPISDTTSQSATAKMVAEPSQQGSHKRSGKVVIRGTITYKDYKIEIKDDLSYGFALQVMRKIKKELEEDLGVRLDLV
jgi:hypothetical protein